MGALEEPIVRGATLLAGTLGETPVSAVGAPEVRTIAEGVSALDGALGEVLASMAEAP